jgi:hypothetical protein
VKAEQGKNDRIRWHLTTWEGSRREQLEQGAKLSFDQILEAQEQMAEITSKLTGRKNPASLYPHAGNSKPKRVAEKPAKYKVARRRAKSR